MSPRRTSTNSDPHGEPLARLRLAGSDADRALLARAEPPILSERFRSSVREAIETRLAPRGRRRAGRRLAIALATTLVAGSALAFGMARHWMSLHDARAGSPPPRVLSSIAPAAPDVDIDLPALAPPTPAPPTFAPSGEPRLHRRRGAVRSQGHAPAQGQPPLGPMATPALTGPPETWPREVDERDAEETPSPAPRLVVSREGHPDVSVVLAGERVVGRIRGTPVALTVTRAQILGRVGDENVWLWLHDRAAEGTIAGLPVRFELVDAPEEGLALREGFFVHGPLPSETTRLTSSASALGWRLGCGAPLPLVARGTYEGSCASGQRARVTIPERWQELPVLSRLILLSLFLSGRDPALRPLSGTDHASP